jgi:cell division septal protein FtsQ
VELSRKLPATIEIRFYLRRPAFQAAVEQPGGFKYELIDDEGVVLGSRNVRSNDLIVIKDVEPKDRHNILRCLAELNTIKNRIDYVGYNEPYGIMVKLKEVEEIFYPGESDFNDKIRYYRELKCTPLLEKYRIKSVDLRFTGRFYFEYEEEGNVNTTQDEEVNG